VRNCFLNNQEIIMSNYQVHTKETASPPAADILANAEKSFGFIPNLLGVMAESPVMLKAYLALGKIFDETSFTPTERQVVILTASRFNDCRYCMAAHSVVAGMQNIPADVVDAIRNDLPIADGRLEILRRTVTTAIDQRGWLSEDDKDAFFAAGYTQAQLFEVILGISYKTLSNYVNHIADAPLDNAFASGAWAPVEIRLAS
jgi:alkylhydroperoxidase family enzyme